MSRARSFLLQCLLASLLLVTAVASRAVWLGALGNLLVRADQPFHADIAVVLAGDGYGNRIRKAAELVREGFAPRILVSGPEGHYGHHESDLAIPFAVRSGYPAEWFRPFPNTGTSTRDEAELVVRELRRIQVRKFLVVTSDFHTRRARHVYQSLASGMEFRVIAAPDRFFNAEGWWRSRQGQKQFVFEWIKTIADWLGF